MASPTIYCSRPAIAAAAGVTRAALQKWALPAPDVVLVGPDGRQSMGWAPETIAAWTPPAGRIIDLAALERMAGERP